MDVEFCEVIRKGISGAAHGPTEAEATGVGDAIYHNSRNVCGAKIHGRAEHDVAALRLQAEAAIGSERYQHAPTLLRQGYKADATADAEIVLVQLNRVGRCKGNRDGHKEQEKQVKASHSCHFPQS